MFKIDEKVVTSVLLALLIFAIVKKMFLDKALDKFIPSFELFEE